ncbi:MAG: hypothetical protein J6F30_12985 [Cellulosilyticum sp.]|nr:hypothetical protein [Cellulosilyticum sp.]
MQKISTLYRPFHLKKSYKDINEEQILSSLYTYKNGTVEEVVSRLINEAVLQHMHLYIDSTITQVVALNEYLCSLFMNNLETLMLNYFLYYLETMPMEEIDEETITKLEQLAQSVEMTAPLEELTLKIDELCKV